MKLYLATQNPHKVKELAQLFPDHEILPAPCAFEVVEDGLRFFENARKKAEALYRILGAPVLADDSGLCIDAFDGGPSIYTARFGDELGLTTSEERYQLVLSRMEGVPTPKRGAHFVCALWAILDKDNEHMTHGRFDGRIAEHAIPGGFGYDPIFYLPEREQMASELSIEEKNRLSHRGRAARVMNALLKEYDALD